MKPRHRLTYGLPILLMCGAVMTLESVEQESERRSAKSRTGSWAMYGKDLAGSHYAPDETVLTRETVGRLKPKWIFATEGDVSSQPTVVDGMVYFGSWDGKQYAVEAATGKKVWEYDCGTPSRAGAAYSEGVLYFGDLSGRLYAVDSGSGSLKWSRRIDDHPRAVVTSSPKVHEGRIYIGLASHEEGERLRQRDYACCTFRGGVAAFDARTGEEVWRFRTIQEEPKELIDTSQTWAKFGPAGVPVWSTLGLDPGANRIYLTTGNQYSGEDAKLVDSIVAITMDEGKFVWSYQARPSDVFIIGCRECGPDFDFGTTPLPVRGPGGRRLLAAGQKSGWVHAVDSSTGDLVWQTEIGPGSALGGIQFGNASDGERIYAAQAHPARGGSVAVIDGSTGKIIWQTPSPDKRPNYGPLIVTGRGENRLVFAGSSAGFIRAYDGEDGKILWEFDTGGAIGGGPSVVDGVLYVGSGYTFLRVGKPNNKLYAFSLDGK